MKKTVALFLAMLMALSLAACSKAPDPAENAIFDVSQNTEPASGQADAPAPGEPSAAPESAPVDADLGAWQQSKTGKFYSRFADGRIYMEYEMEYDGTSMSVISATSNDKTYSESRVNGQSSGASIMDGEYMYVIDHANKMVIKMSLQAAGQEMVNTMIEEEDVDPAQMTTGAREIAGKTYDTEEWSIDGARSIMCFDGNELAYMIGEYDGEETIIKVVKVSGDVDESLFEIPSDYEVVSY